MSSIENDRSLSLSVSFFLSRHLIKQIPEIKTGIVVKMVFAWVAFSMINMKQMAYLKSWASSFLSAFLSGLKDPFKSSFIHCSQRHPPPLPRQIHMHLSGKV